jgi:hypothetical protein
MKETFPGTNVMLTFSVGSEVVVMTFASVSTTAITTIQTVAPSDPLYVPPPAGVNLGSSPIYYEITTTAEYTPPLDICMSYPIPPAGVDPPRMLHYDGTSWENVTRTVDTQQRVVCGQVTSLSPVILAYDDNSASGSAMSDPHLVGANGVCVWGSETPSVYTW